MKKIDRIFCFCPGWLDKSPGSWKVQYCARYGGRYGLRTRPGQRRGVVHDAESRSFAQGGDAIQVLLLAADLYTVASAFDARHLQRAKLHLLHRRFERLDIKKLDITLRRTFTIL